MARGMDMADTEDKKVVGRAEGLSFPELGFESVSARIDTGAKTSAIWASQVNKEGDQLKVVFFDEQSDLYTGHVVTFNEFETTVVASSTGHTQARYKVRLLAKLKGKKIRAWFTLADRSSQVYPVLIGRNVLLGKFIVDVKKGKSLKEAERKRTEDLRNKLDEIEEEE
jgi:hypothetical protein